MSVFLEIPEVEWVASNALAFAVRDRFPVSEGHTLVVTRRVVSDWFAATDDERAAVMALVTSVKERLDRELRPHGYNVGFNAGLAAGQTVMHLHVHVIPRFRGDMDDPRGGVRHVIPSKGNYARAHRPLATGGTKNPLSAHILPLLDEAKEVAIVAAFVQESGVVRLRRPLREALARGAQVRILTGDYLEITSAEGLAQLLDLQQSEGLKGTLATRVIEVAALEGTKVFHPKSWRFEAPTFGVAFVGSSNLSRSALDAGLEWNLRIDRDRDHDAYSQIRAAFEELWLSATPLEAEWLRAYSVRAQATSPHAIAGEKAEEAPERAPEPHAVQAEALAKLRDARARGMRRGLVVLATGLGKTWLSAFDYWQLRDELGATPRLLFLAHRDELLDQAAATFRRLFRAHGQLPRVSWCRGAQGDLTGDLVFASIAKLGRKERRAALAQQSFDYVVIDEVHHAAADSYRRILDAIDPRWLLGLTATPDRADARDVYGLLDDNEIYRADIGRGVADKMLAPFRYYGVKDDIDYENIPWRNRQFDPDELARAAQTQQRTETMWRAWGEHPGGRSIVFCCSVAHALYVRDELRARGVNARAVFAAEGTDPREASLKALAKGEVDAVCAVDLFNEGVDVPTIDRVVMLRPTESGVLFLQQLGRGLRASPGKEAVTVIDFVGNHRVFLERLRTLLSLGRARTADVRQFLGSQAAAELPEGCSVELELEAKELLRKLYRAGGADEVERAYRELRAEQGERPTAGQLQRAGYLLRTLRDRHASWFEFVDHEGDLAEDERAALPVGLALLHEIEMTEISRCFKMVTLEALLDADALFAGLPLRDLARRAHALLRRSPELFEDVAEGERVPELTPDRERGWLAYWRRNPIEAWTSQKAGRRVWFQVREDRFEPTSAFDPMHHEALARMARELVDLRLAQYRARKRSTGTSEGFVCKVLWNQRDPILKLPPRSSASMPEGEADVRLSDGAVWQFRFAKEYCNVARPAGTQVNRLPDLLRRWFGPRAGQPGTGFEVRFVASPDGLWVEPVRVQVVTLPFGTVTAFPDLRAAAGFAASDQAGIEPERIALPIAAESPDLFAVRVAGSSMDGGDAPLRDGDWALMRFARSASAEALANRVILTQVPGDGDAARFQIKRLRRRDGAWWLTSDNPDGPAFVAGADVVPIARLERSVRPEEVAPAVGTTVSDLRAAFGFPVEPSSGRHEGHLFVFVDRSGVLVDPDRVRFRPDRMRPSETAFVLAKTDGGDFRYLGVGRSDGDGLWTIQPVDYATWKRWGEGREVSRRLPDGALSRAQEACDALLSLPEEERAIEQSGGARAKISGRAARGGLRVEGTFEPRTVSLVDLGWVIAADDDVSQAGGRLDEERVNRLRYLEGTPKGSTRWIDTGWALAAWARAKTLVRDHRASDTSPRYVRRDGGETIDASFRVEQIGEELSVVFESRGGTRGTRAERNVDYNEGLELLLARLGEAGITLADASVESRDTSAVPREERRLRLEPIAYPIRIEDARQLRLAMSRAQARVGRAPGASGGGNSNKRLRLVLARTAGWTADALGTALAKGSSPRS